MPSRKPFFELLSDIFETTPFFYGWVGFFSYLYDSPFINESK